MRGTSNPALGTLIIACVAPFIASAATETNTTQATWKPQEIRYTYNGFTTAYSCDAAEDKLEQILKTLGAHPNTKVRASGCSPNRPAKDFFVTVTTAMPTLVDANKPVDRADGKVLSELHMDQAALTQPFPVEWRTVDLSRDRKLNLQPGDCELLEGLREHVLPKLSLKIVEDRVSCTPRQLDVQTPTLKVAALVPAKNPDQG